MDVTHETERLTLRAFDASDVDALYAIQGDRDYMRFTHWSESRDACAAWLQQYVDAEAEVGFAPWTIVHRADRRIVGWGGLNIDPNAREWGPEVSYFIHSGYQGTGLATELVRASLEVGFVASEPAADRRLCAARKRGIGARAHEVRLRVRRV